MTQFLCFAALLLLCLMQLTQAVATPNNNSNNNNNNSNKPKAVAQVQPGNVGGNKPSIAATTIKPQRVQPGKLVVLPNKFILF